MTTLTTPDTAARYQRRCRFAGGAEATVPACWAGGAGGGLTAGVVDIRGSSLGRRSRTCHPRRARAMVPAGVVTACLSPSPDTAGPATVGHVMSCTGRLVLP